jgi:hypothetical protein
MTNEQIAQWAREVGMETVLEFGITRFARPKQLQQFAALVRNATLEEAAVTCEKEAAKFPVWGVGSEDSDISYIELIRSMKS